MIRRLLAIGTAVALPPTAIAGIAAGAGSGVAGAAAPRVAPATCVISGDVAFGGAGISEGGNVGTAKTDTSETHRTGTGTNCQTSPLTTPIVEKTSTCSQT